MIITDKFTHIIIVAFLLLSAFSVMGQERLEHVVSGVILDNETEKPLSLARIFVSDSVGTQVARTLTLDDGRFRFKITDGRYSVLITHTGHKSQILNVSVLGADKDIGNVNMAVGEELQGAGIVSDNLLTRTEDRYIYDVSRDPDRDRMTMAEMMKKVPQVRMAAKDGKLQFGNEPVAEIRINDSRSGLINVARQYPMEFIKAGYMKTIELVMPGSPEYRNDKPILLITLARPLPYGFAGNLDAIANTKNSYSPSADLVANTPIIGVGVSYGYEYTGEPSLTDSTVRIMSDGMVIAGSQTRKNVSSGHNVGMNFFRGFLNDRIKVNARLGGSFSDASSLSESVTGTVSETLSKDYSKSSSEGSSKSPFRLSGAINLDGKFGPVGPIGKIGKHSWSLGYSYRNRYNTSSTEYTYSSSPQTIQTAGDKEQEHRLQAEVKLKELLRKPFTVSAFAKAGWYGRKFDNSTVYGENVKGMDYRQNVAFLEVAAVGSILKNLSYMLYLNAEYVVNSGTITDFRTVSPIDYKEFNLMPDVSLSWRIGHGSLSASYRRKVKRPGMSQLNPADDNSDPYNIRTGNPRLKGEKTDIYSLGYALRPALRWFRDFNVSVSYSDSKNMISRLVTADASGVSTSTYCNLGRRPFIQALIRAGFNPVKSLNLSLSVSYSHIKNVLPSGKVNSFDSPVALLSISWCPKWFEISGSVVCKRTLSSVQSTGMTMEPDAELSLSRYFAKPHIGVSVAVSDLLHSGSMRRSTIKYDNFVQYNYNERRGRVFNFRIYWRFGKFRQQKNTGVDAYDM